MSYTATISDPHEPDAMPMWESFDHPTFDDAYRAGQAHVQAAQPGDRIVDEGHALYAIWGADRTARCTHVATLVIAPTDDIATSNIAAQPTA
jgi:hypothetical protein